MSLSCYYLHENGNLIHKPADSAVDIRDSSFARGLWFIDPQNRETAWVLLVEAMAAGADIDRVTELATLWGCNDEDAQVFAQRVGCLLQRDGAAWHAARRHDFTNIQESASGFGSTALSAMAELARTLGYRPSKMWGVTFKDLLAQAKAERARPMQPDAIAPVAGSRA